MTTTPPLSLVAPLAREKDVLALRRVLCPPQGGVPLPPSLVVSKLQDPRSSTRKHLYVYLDALVRNHYEESKR